MADSTQKAPRKNARTKKQAAPIPAPVREALPLRGKIPSLSPAQAAALRGLFAAPQGWTLRDDCVLQFMPGRPAPPAQTFELDAEGARIGLHLRSAAHAGGMHWSDYHGRSRVLAWSLAHEAQLMRLSEAFGIAFTPIPEPDGAAQDGDALLWLDFIVDELADEDAAPRMPALQGALRMPVDWSERLLQRADPPYDDAPPALGRWRELGVPIVLRWSIAPLPPDDWASLRPGDVILAGRRGQAPRAMAAARGLAWPLSASTGGWQVSGPPVHLQTPVQETPPMNEQAQDAGDGANPETAVDSEALARRLPVDVAFEIGRTELRVGELSQLQPGYVFALAAPLEGGNVTIRANGQAVGQGELVAVGDTLGVRLLGWS